MLTNYEASHDTNAVTPPPLPLELFVVIWSMSFLNVFLVINNDITFCVAGQKHWRRKSQAPCTQQLVLLKQVSFESYSSESLNKDSRLLTMIIGVTFIIITASNFHTVILMVF